MIRLTVTLIVAIYVVLIVVPDADHGEHVTVTRNDGQNWLVAMITDAEAGAQRPPTDRTPSVRALRASLTDELIETADGFALETSDGERLDIAAVINPVDLLPDNARTDVSVASVSFAVVPELPAADAPDATLASAPVAAAAPIWRVAATAVNFREGPSTNTAILASLSRGEEVEFLSEAPDNWARLRVVSSGLEGYMAAQFLEPTN
ncbi:SH3 domain-containing protein [Jannaschia sp. CCS1]|uniref:SH3 domain-containing protein n=1 Tax=Jannaschia sp. (strain CCS1) TaxID=290400 RepID=UPI000053DBD4|nr:SH3 domain-containing protein [Jannaschia sp. CCS1]ABD53469.1 SH3 type 3 [Jannaschia sp. CCS1]